jgi:hypothetical protein
MWHSLQVDWFALAIEAHPSVTRIVAETVLDTDNNPKIGENHSKS